MFGKKTKTNQIRSRRQQVRRSFESLEAKKLFAADLFQINELATMGPTLEGKAAVSEVTEAGIETDVTLKNAADQAFGREDARSGPIETIEIQDVQEIKENLDAPAVDRVLGNSLATDLNGDGFVDFVDFLDFSSAFGQKVDQGTRGDFDGDGVVGFLDFLRMSSDFGKTSPTEPEVTVAWAGSPDGEPTSSADRCLALRAADGVRKQSPYFRHSDVGLTTHLVHRRVEPAPNLRCSRTPV